MKKNYTHIKVFIVLVSMLTLRLGAQPLSGTVTINSAMSTGGTNYQTWAALVTSLTASGVNGPLVVDVVANSGPYNEQPAFPQITGMTATNSITINGNGNTLQFNSNNSLQPFTMCLKGTDYMFVNNLNIIGQGSTYAMVVVLSEGANYNTFSSCTFSAPLNGTSSYQIPYSISSYSYSPSSGLDAGNYNTVRSCTLQNGYYGAFVMGLTGAPYNTGNTLDKCLITDFYMYGVYHYYMKNFTAKNNTLQRPTRTSSSTIYAFYGPYNQGMMLDGNRIHKMYESNLSYTGTFYGFYNYYTTAPNSANRNMIRNNLICDINFNGSIYGTYCYYMDGDIVNNTFSFDQTNSTGGSVYGLYYNYGSAPSYVINMTNNIVSITKGGSGTKYGMYVGGNISGQYYDRNDYYVNSIGGGNNVGYFSANAVNLSALQSQGVDLTSMAANPQYSNAAAGDFHPTNAAIDNTAIPSGILLDQMGYVRSGTTPDIGALEFLTPLCSGTPSANAVSGANYLLCPGQSASLSIANLNNVAPLGFTFQWQTSNVSAVGPWTPIVNATGLTYTTPALNQTTYYSIVLTCTNAGGGTISPATTVNIAGTTTSVVPYFEGFENIGITNRLPNCSWAATNINNAAFTYTSAGSAYRLPRTGNNFASFSNVNSAGTNYYYTNAIQLNAGITYSASMWYLTEALYGYANWTDLSIMVGTAQNASGLTTIASTGNAAIALQYKSLSNTFTVASSGLYYVAIKATSTSGGAQYLSWDDLQIIVPCQIASNAPLLTAVANSTTICSGSPVGLTASGAGTYTWSTGSTQAAITATPQNNTVYSVMGTSSVSGCMATASVAVTVNQAPTIVVTSNPPSVCSGQNANLTASGASTYTWNTGSNNSVLQVAPLGSTGYSVAGKGSNGCSAVASVFVPVNSSPTIQAAALPSQICVGETATLQPTTGGNVTYQWVGPNLFIPASQAYITGSLIGTVMYTLSATDQNGCTGTSQVALTVNGCVGLASNGSLESLSIYPNPNNGAFVIELNNGLDKDIQVTDVTGRIVAVAHSSESKTDVNISSLASGIYYVKIQSNNAVEVVKVVKH